MCPPGGQQIRQITRVGARITARVRNGDRDSEERAIGVGDSYFCPDAFEVPLNFVGTVLERCPLCPHSKCQETKQAGNDDLGNDCLHDPERQDGTKEQNGGCDDGDGLGVVESEREHSGRLDARRGAMVVMGDGRYDRRS